MLFANQIASTPADRMGYALSSDGTKIYFEIRGEGPPLVILNNFFMTASQWELFTRRIRQEFSVVSYDLRHQGKSDRMEGVTTVEDHVRDLGAVINHLGYSSVSLLGTCVSTLFCRDYALLHPDKVSRLVLVGPIFSAFGNLHRTFIHKSLLASLDAGGPEALFDHYYPLLYTPKTIGTNRSAGYLALKLRFVDNNPAEQLFKHLHSTLKIDDRPEDLKRIQAPTLLLSGEHDFLGGRQALEALCRFMPKARYELIEGTGHNPYVEATAEFECKVLAFLRESGPALKDQAIGSFHATAAAAQ